MSIEVNRVEIGMPYKECKVCDAIELDTKKLIGEALDGSTYVFEVNHRCKNENLCRAIREAQDKCAED